MTQFYLVGEVPVKMIRQAEGTTMLEAFNRRTGRFETNSRYYTTIRRDDTGLPTRLPHPDREYDRRETLMTEK